MIFERISYSDIEQIKLLQPEGWTDISKEFEFYINSSFCYPIKALVHDKIVGVGASIIFEKTSWIAHIVVDKDYRNQGIGYEIVEKLLAYIKSNSVNICLLIATDLGLPVYVKFGFRYITEYIFFKRDKPWVQKTYSKKIVPYNYSHCLQILGMDKEITGENRESLLFSYLPTSLVYFDNGKVIGYYIPDLRDGPIVAQTDEAGLELMKIKYAKIDKAVIPSENRVGIEFLKQNGFVESETKGTRMIFGNNVSWKPENIFSRISGNFG